LVIVLFGVATLFNEKLTYYNSWSGIVFAPIAIIIGALGLIIAIFKSKVLAQPPKKKSRFRGWPKGRARYWWCVSHSSSFICSEGHGL
jgi:hypothetical protein